MRKLASIRRIKEIKKIDGADKICAYNVDGWWVVDAIDRYQISDLVVYIEIDSWVPHDLAPFLSKGKEPREYEGIKGERLRTVKLRGQVSQGLILPIDPTCNMIESSLMEGLDVTFPLNIRKYEPPIPAQLAGLIKGNFPAWGYKTDQERCQNLVKEIQQAYDDDIKFEVTIKLDGSSMSVGQFEDETVVCSRNLSLKLDQDANTFVNTARKDGLLEKVVDLKHIMISGELMGPGIQKNREGLKEHEFFVFDIFDPKTSAYISTESRYCIVESLGVKHVPILHKSITLRELGLDSIEKILEFADGPSLNASTREGVVFKSIDGSFSFKAISNKFLLKDGD